MYTKLLASTALSLVLVGGAAVAQDSMTADPMMEAPADTMAAPEAPEEPLVNASEAGINADGWLASEIMGEDIYNSTADDAETIGEVNDFVLDPNGEIGAVVVGVGGFLGIGQKNVAINWDELELAQDAEGNQRLVANMTREQLENAAEFDRAEWLASERAAMEAAPAADPAAEPMAPAGDAMAPAADPMAPAAEPMAEEPAEDAMATDPAMESQEEVPADNAMAPADGAMAPADGAANTGLAWDSYEAVELEELTADNLTGTAVYGADDEDLGDIGDIILSEDGSVDAVIIDFGGFLGIGTKPVAVGFDNLTFLRDDNGDLLLRTNLTAEDLEAAPDYDETTYVENPEENTFIVR